MDEVDWNRLKTVADKMETPFVVFDLKNLDYEYNDLVTNFPGAKVYYAIKANPAKEILARLIELGSNFDVASVYELDRVLELGCTPERLSYGNTIKKRRDIQYFYEKGVRLYASDSESDLKNIAEFAPGSDVYVRLITEGDLTADWPLSRKFGCHSDMAMDLLIMARNLGLRPVGVSFHVGSQQRDIGAWDAAVAKASTIYYRMLEEDGIKLSMINIGGGMPAHYLSKTHNIQTYAREIIRFMKEDFGDDLPQIILEPGRSLVGDLGVLVSEVVNISRKDRNALNRWVFTDIGKFGGMMETLGEAIKYPLFTERTLERPVPFDKEEEVIIAGPTCDSMDVLYEDFKYSLPLDIKTGDRLYWFSTGAYTTSYSSVEFNGFPPLKAYYVH